MRVPWCVHSNPAPPAPAFQHVARMMDSLLLDSMQPFTFTKITTQQLNRPKNKPPKQSKPAPMKPQRPATGIHLKRSLILKNCILVHSFIFIINHNSKILIYKFCSRTCRTDVRACIRVKEGGQPSQLGQVGGVPEKARP